MNMKNFNALLITIAVLSAAFNPISSLAQETTSTFAQRCNPTPESKRSIDLAIRDKVLAAIDLSLYDNVNVRAVSKVISFTEQPTTIDSNQLLSGITVEPQSFPAGLAYGITGSISLDLDAVCTYEMRVEIKMRGTVKETGERLQAQTQSQITVTTPVSQALKKIS